MSSDDPPDDGYEMATGEAPLGSAGQIQAIRRLPFKPKVASSNLVGRTT
jgi:hypothetical protein